MAGQKVIYFENLNAAAGNSVVSISPHYKGGLAAVAEQAIKEQGLPDDTAWQEVEDALEPIFKGARKVENGKLIAGLAKSKLIAHDFRRVNRSKEFSVIDGDNENVQVSAQAQAKRQVVRDKYAQLQMDIDSVTDGAELKQLMADTDLI
jgi:hypothetical protein